MTREEAIAQLKMDRDLCNFNPMTGKEEPMNEDCKNSVEALDMAIEALEQQPCEDTIGRQAVIDTIMGQPPEPHYPSWYAAQIEKLPSAQPERKKGRWIPVDSYSAFGGDEATWMAHGNPVAFYYCSECKEQAYAGEDGESLLTDYCPNCGADMRGE